MTAGGLLALSGRMTVRDWRAGEVRVLALSLAIAVAALTSVGFFVDRAQRALQQQAARFLGADLSLESDRPIDAQVKRQAQDFGLRVADTVTFPSMATGQADPQRTVLVAVKAVSAGYPLRGDMMLVHAAATSAASSGPPRGTAWVDPQVIDALDLDADGRLRLGESRFEVAGAIASEPDRAGQFVGFAPRIMIGLEDLPATELVQPGSRVSYHLLAAGEPPAVQRLADWLRPRLARGQRLQTLQEGRPDLHAALERARQFLTLIALLAALLASVAVASAAHRFTQRRIDSCAVLRCLGLTGAQLTALFSLEFAWIGAASCLAGALAGFAMHHAIVAMLGGLLPTSLPPASGLPALQAIACGMALLAGFGLPPVVRLRRVPPLRVLRRDAAPLPESPAAMLYAIAAATFLALLLWLADDRRLALYTAAGFAGAGLAYALLAWGWLRGLIGLRRRVSRLPDSVGFALAAMGRRPAATVAQITALSFGLSVLLVMAVVRGDLLRQWQAQVPPDAPNRFIINIQPDQAGAVAGRLGELGIAHVVLHPMVRGRLVQVNGKPVDPERFKDQRARGLIEREFNLSYAQDAPAYNRIVEGRWFAPDAAELSIEQGIAQTLGIRLGDELVFDVAGQPVRALTTSVRQLSWDSMKVNFFVITSPALLRDQPRTFITSIYVPPAVADPTPVLVRQFRNLTVIDTGAVLAQVRSLLDQLSRAVQFVVLFALAAGMLVLYAALSSSQDERAHEAALLRAFGATRARLRRAQVAEMAAIGATSGLLASAGASAVGWLLAHQVLHFEYRLHPETFVAGIALGMACALAGGTLALRRVVRTPPITVLREA
jgi:putative ABC transport system permease protein